MKEKEEEQHAESAVEKENKEQITDGMVHIYGEEVEFEQKTVEELRIRMLMPKKYDLLDEEVKEVLFPLGNRPSHVFASGDVQGNVSMNLTPSAVPNEHIKDFMPMIKKLMEQMGPKTKILRTEVIQKEIAPKEEINIGIMQFLSHAIDMKVYNVMSFFSMEGKLLILTISFPNKLSERYVTLAKQMIDSLEILAREE